jgi:hypothetical protein
MAQLSEAPRYPLMNSLAKGILSRRANGPFQDIIHWVGSYRPEPQIIAAA